MSTVSGALFLLEKKEKCVKFIYSSLKCLPVCLLT